MYSMWISFHTENTTETFKEEQMTRDNIKA